MVIGFAVIAGVCVCVCMCRCSVQAHMRFFFFDVANTYNSAISHIYMLNRTSTIISESLVPKFLIPGNTFFFPIV